MWNHTAPSKRCIFYFIFFPPVGCWPPPTAKWQKLQRWRDFFTNVPKLSLWRLTWSSCPFRELLSLSPCEAPRLFQGISPGARGEAGSACPPDTEHAVGRSPCHRGLVFPGVRGRVVPPARFARETQDRYPRPLARPRCHPSPWCLWLPLSVSVTACAGAVRCSCPELCTVSPLFLKGRWQCLPRRCSGVAASVICPSRWTHCCPSACAGPFPLCWMWHRIAALCCWVSACGGICRWKTFPKSASWQSVKAELGLKHH